MKLGSWELAELMVATQATILFIVGVVVLVTDTTGLTHVIR